MSEEKDVSGPDEPEESEPERKFSQDHYDRLMKGQEPWLAFLAVVAEDRGDPWTAFEEDWPDLAAATLKAVVEWNADPPRPALLGGPS